MTTHNKKLYRNNNDKVIFGVMGGLGEYFEVDSTLLRVIYIVLCIFTALVPGVVAYILMALVMPPKPETIHEKAN